MVRRLFRTGARSQTPGSEGGRVGEEGRSRWVPDHLKKKKIIAQLKRARKIGTPQIIVTSDFETNRLWVYKPCEHYTATTEEDPESLREWDVPSHVDVAG